MFRKCWFYLTIIGQNKTFFLNNKSYILDYLKKIQEKNITYYFFFAANIQNTQNDILLYIGVTIAIFMVCFLSFFIVRIYRKKGQHQSLYNMASNGE